MSKRELLGLTGSLRSRRTRKVCRQCVRHRRDVDIAHGTAEPLRRLPWPKHVYPLNDERSADQRPVSFDEAQHTGHRNVRNDCSYVLDLALHTGDEFGLVPATDPQ